MALLFLVHPNSIFRLSDLCQPHKTASNHLLSHLGLLHSLLRTHSPAPSTIWTTLFRISTPRKSYKLLCSPSEMILRILILEKLLVQQEIINDQGQLDYQATLSSGQLLEASNLSLEI